jgi:hypothetical protein
LTNASVGEWLYFYTINKTDRISGYYKIKKDGTNLTEIDNIFNEDVFKYPEKNISILYKFYVDPDRGYSLYLPKNWFLYDPSSYPYEGSWYFQSLYEGILGLIIYHSGTFSREGLINEKQDELEDIFTEDIKTLGGLDCFIIYGVTEDDDINFEFHIRSEEEYFVLELDTDKSTFEKYKNVLFDMAKRFEFRDG